MKPAILASSYIGPKGYGNNQTGLKPWAPELLAGFQRCIFSSFQWNHIFDSDPGRFNRMDLMCRFGLAAVELLRAHLDPLSSQARDRTGVCVETQLGSISADLEFLQTPRASNFPYTLPSAIIGEICIRHHLRGPIRCSMPITPNRVPAEAIHLLNSNEADYCVCLSCNIGDENLYKLLPETPRDWHSAAMLLSL
jgi:hypothetical protein